MRRKIGHSGLVAVGLTCPISMSKNDRENIQRKKRSADGNGFIIVTGQAKVHAVSSRCCASPPACREPFVIAVTSSAPRAPVQRRVRATATRNKSNPCKEIA
jgi:hypothetical protein